MLVESRSSDDPPSMSPVLGHGVAAKVVNIYYLPNVQTYPHQDKRLKLYGCLDGSPTRAHIVALPLCRVKGTFIDNNPIPVAKERFRFMPLNIHRERTIEAKLISRLGHELKIPPCDIFHSSWLFNEPFDRYCAAWIASY